MIFGANFGGPAIPDTPRSAFRKFKPTMRVSGQRAMLVGIGQSEAERDRMVTVATNGSRQIHVEPKQTTGGVWYGIYVY